MALIYFPIHGLVATESMLEMGGGWDMESARWRAEGLTGNCLLASIENSRAFSGSLTCPLCEADSVGTVRLLSLHQIPHLLIYLMVNYDSHHSPAQVAHWYWLPVLNLTVSITSQGPEATFKDYKLSSCINLWESLSLGNVQQTLSRQWLLWDLRPSFPFPLFNKPTTHTTNTLVERKKPPDFRILPVGASLSTGSSTFPWDCMEPKPSWKQTRDKPCSLYGQAE